MSKPKVVIYGASGYTGKLIAWHLAERGIPFIAAGRNLARLQEQMSSVSELRGHSYECLEVAHDYDSMKTAFAGAKVVYNVVGPFMQLSEPVVRACRDAGVHYMDTTGEQDWMRFLEEKYGQAFKDRDLLLCPANAWMWTAGELAAELALETPGIDTLDIAYMGDSNTSVASTMSFLRMCCADQYYLKNGVLEVWPHGKAYEVTIPGDHRIYRALPWGGAGEPVWRRLDSRVRNCSVLVAFKNQDVMDWIVGRIKDWHDNYRSMPREEFERMSNGWGNALVNTEPPREVREENRSVVCCHARGNTRSTTVVLRGNSPYVQAGVWAAESVSRLISGRLRATGFASPSRAFGHRELLAATAESGYLTWQSTSN